MFVPRTRTDAFLAQYFYLLVLALCFAIGHCATKGRTKCGPIMESLTHSHVDAYYCPTDSHTDSATQCCEIIETNCCRDPTLFETFKNSTIAVCGFVVVIAILFTIAVIVCVCHERCPLHKAVRRHPELDYLPTAQDTEYLSGVGMPCEKAQDVRVYEVNPDICFRQNPDHV
ncbi:hypothetical protein L596_004457 [Steinernema carpocapsae]|uniref:Uncharacterized protein n=1 Tax=Steinernema carpocapsae TaxID=34508 RepID=A0A4U8UZZ8_STECR|nr:hypothetical protein L596_004457 [Steinernema carpocapsae]